MTVSFHRMTDRAANAIVVALVICHAGLLSYAAVRQAPTLDEPAHLVAGLSQLEFGQFDVYCVNPPLVHYVAALPVWYSGYVFDWSAVDEVRDGRPEFAMGRAFVQSNASRALQLVVLARWACVPFSLLGAVVCYLWGREFWQANGAGVVSATLWCFDPNVIAHGSLLTADCAAMALGIAAAYCFWRWLRMPRWSMAIAAGLMMGLALLSKTLWIVLFVLWPLCGAIRMVEHHRQASAACSEHDVSRTHYALQLVSILAMGLYVLNAGYSFSDTLTPLRQFTFVSRALVGTAESRGNRFADSFLGNIPVPVPADYVRGLDKQKKDLEGYGKPSYLRGQWSNHGWWYYYVYGLAVKMPHGSQAVVMLAVLAVFGGVLSKIQPTSSSLCVLLATPVMVLVLVSWQRDFNHHVRYALPMVGFLYVFAGGAALWFDEHRSDVPPASDVLKIGA